MSNWYRLAIADLSKEVHEINPEMMPVYCCVCKKQMKGYPVDYDHPSVSHGCCDDCAEDEYKRLNEDAEKLGL